MTLSHGSEVAEALSSIDRWLTVLAFVGSFALLLVLGDLLVGALLRIPSVYRAVVWLGLGPWEEYEDLEGPYPVLSLFDVDPETGKIEPVPYIFGPALVECEIPDVGADGVPRSLSPEAYRRTLQHKPPRVETSASGWGVHEFEPDGPEDSYPLCRRCRGGRFNEIHRVPKLAEIDDPRR